MDDADGDVIRNVVPVEAGERQQSVGAQREASGRRVDDSNGDAPARASVGDPPALHCKATAPCVHWAALEREGRLFGVAYDRRGKEH